MTTNAGAEESSRRSIGFNEQNHTTDAMEVIRKQFTPEFRNRLDSIIQFDPLNEQIIEHVVDKFLTELQAQLEDKKVVIYATDEARSWLAKHGYDPAMGARPMSRLIQEKVKKSLAEEILFGGLSAKGGTVKIDIADDDIVLVVVEEEEAATTH